MGRHFPSVWSYLSFLFYLLQFENHKHFYYNTTMSPQPIISGLVALSIGTNHIHVYQVYNTHTQFAKTIYDFGALSPPLITSPPGTAE